MIWITAVMPPSTSEEFPPHQPEFVRRTKETKTDFGEILRKEEERIDVSYMESNCRTN